MTGTASPLAEQSGWRSRVLPAFCIWLVLASLSLLPGFQLLDSRFYDLFSTLAPPAPTATPVVLVGIDEPSFAELGLQWPWPRELHASLLDSLAAAGAAVIALDIVFAEPSAEESDQALAASIRRAGKVILAADLAVEETAHVSQLIRVEPLQLFQEAGASSGVASVSLDKDGVMRRLPSYQDGFAAAILTAWLKAAKEPEAEIPRGARLLRFFGPSRTYPYASYYQALDPDHFLPPNFFRNRVVLVGRSVKTSPDPAARQADMFATPFTLATGELMAGIEVHATVFDNLRLALSVTPAPRSVQPAGLALVIIFSFFLFRRWHPWTSGALALLAMTLIMIGSYIMLRFAQVWLSPPLFLAGVLLSYGGDGARAYLREWAGRRRIKQAFSRYLPPVLVERLASDSAQLRLGGESRHMTVMFCDIRGFTALSERCRNEPERLVRLMNRYFTAMTQVIHQYNGTVDKYIGDCIMAFWNAPLDDPDHAQHACSAALEMFARLAELNDELALEMKGQEHAAEKINIGIGINTGLCVVGNIGSEVRFDYSVLGDSVNLASRLEGRTKEYGVGIVIGPETAAAAADYATLELDLLAVKGKMEAVRIYTLLRPEELPGKQDMHDFARSHAGMLEAYRLGDWAGARAALAECRANAPGLASLYRLYDQRLSEYEHSPPPENWTGISIARSK
ncbi:MAG TPA: adenylate/guanylate cyclase domain-containing protein [Desulfobulbaceae bacterium]|nr:adenylate/guanylate cyclase domain-containing protein [Desulfobulbaceae bacterium]